jgi:hypothetical protein
MKTPTWPAINLNRLRKRFPQLDFGDEDGVIKIGPAVGPAIVTIEREDDRKDWTVFTEEWHGHYDSSREALDIALLILAGLARTVREFRNDELAATWLEVWDQNAFLVQNEALYFNPFDTGEWDSLLTDVWRTERIHRRFIDLPDQVAELDGQMIIEDVPLGEVKQVSKINPGCHIPSDRWMFTLLAGKFGTPAEGMRWTTDKRYQFALQIPVGWRFVRDEEPEEPSNTWRSPEGKMAIRVHLFYREVDPPGEQIPEPLHPLSIDYEFLPEIGSNPVWRAHLWSVYFTDNVYERKADVFLFIHPDVARDSEGYRELMDSAVPLSHIYSGERE